MKIISEDLFEEYMECMCEYITVDDNVFEKVHEIWFKCFSYMLKKMCRRFNKKSIKSLFYEWDMNNWSALHQENTEYMNYSDEMLLDEFYGECAYIVDRFSYDRLFRTHWLFRQRFFKEMLDIII